MNSILAKYIPGLKKSLTLDLSVFDSSFLKQTIASRMALISVESPDLYFAKLHDDLEELTELQRCLNNSYSEFFRNPITFAYLELVILPQLFEKKRTRNAGELRIWSSACAAGQEAYSLAMLCNEQAKTDLQRSAYRIFATDIATIELEFARKGEYPNEVLSKVTHKRVETYFQKQNDLYSIQPALKERIDFSVFDLLSENGTCPPASIYGNFDLVFCSNLLFYYQPKIRELILDKVGKTLAKGGYLVTGETERDILKEYGYREIFAHSAIFQKR